MAFEVCPLEQAKGWHQRLSVPYCRTPCEGEKTVVGSFVPRITVRSFGRVHSEYHCLGGALCCGYSCGKHLLQIFLWERFRSIAPRPTEFKSVVITEEEVDGEAKRMKSHPYTLRPWPWSGVKQATNKILGNVINKEKDFSIHPYIYTSCWNYFTHALRGTESAYLSLRATNLEPLAVVMVALVALRLLSYKLETGEGVALCSP